MASGAFTWRTNRMWQKIKGWLGIAEKESSEARLPMIANSRELDEALSFLDKVWVQTDNTPDLWEKEQQKWVLVFIYDEMMERFLHRPVLGEEAKFIAVVHTKDKFSLFVKKDGNNCDVIMIRGLGKECPVQGELWAVRPKDLINIDLHKRNRVHFRRQRIEVILPFKDKKCPWKEQAKIITCDAHIGKDYWLSRIDGGYEYSHVKRFHHKGLIGGEYYFFTRLEYDGK